MKQIFRLDQRHVLALTFAALTTLTGCVGTFDQESGVGVGMAQAPAQGVVWADNVTISVVGDRMVIESDGVPSHERLDFYAVGNRVIADATRAQDFSFTLPLQPQLAAQPRDTGGGPIGIAISGAVFFNPFEGSQTQYALTLNHEIDGVPFIDPCNGHTVPISGTYHYHGIPYCITHAVDVADEHSRQIGYLMDGFPIYGPQDTSGQPPADLDACNGHFGPTPEYLNGIYHYHTTEGAPYVPTCYAGEAAAPQGGGGQRPPGGPGNPPRPPGG